MPRQYFHGGDGLDSLAQPHIVADQCPASADREQRAYGLIRKKRHFQNGPSWGPAAP
jgi:hypothetical protein